MGTFNDINDINGIIEEFEESITELKKDGMLGSALDRPLETLKKHVNGVIKVEKVADEIRNEIIRPIQNELKRAGTISKVGLVVGLIGFVVTIGGLAYTTFYAKINNTQNIPYANVDNTKKIDAMVQKIDVITPKIDEIGRNTGKTGKKTEEVDRKVEAIANITREIRRELLIKEGKLVIGDGEVKISLKKKHLLVDGVGAQLFISPRLIYEELCEEKKAKFNVALVQMDYKGRLVTHTGVPDTISIKTKHKYTPVLPKDNFFALAENDKITLLGKYEIKVVRVLNRGATRSSLGDKENALVIRWIKRPKKKKKPKTAK